MVRAAIVMLGLGILGTPSILGARDDADALVGTWTWSWKDGEGTTHKHVLEVEGAGDKLAAREKYDEDEPVKVTDLKVEGKSVTFSVQRGKRRSAYTGTIKSKDLIEGTVSVSTDGQANEFGWESKREPTKKKSLRW